MASIKGEDGVGKVAGSRRRVRPDTRGQSTRRAFIAGAVAWSSLAWIEPIRGQPKPKPAIVGWLSVSSRESDADHLAAFKEGLAALGYREGQRYAIEGRWAEGRLERMQSLAEELAAGKPAVIVAWTIAAIRAAAKAGPAAPSVAGGGSVVGKGLAEGFRRAGGLGTRGDTVSS